MHRFYTKTHPAVITFEDIDTSERIGVNLDRPLAKKFKDEHQLISPSIIHILVDYPLKSEFLFTVKGTNGITRGELVEFIVDIYRSIYKKDALTGDFGIYGHALTDLGLYGVEYVEHRNEIPTYKLLVDS